MKKQLQKIFVKKFIDKINTMTVEQIEDFLNEVYEKGYISGEKSKKLYRNYGKGNKGKRNIGDKNFGFGNVGYFNEGYENAGSENKGDGNTGIRNKGNKNSGCSNIGDWNAGHGNIGNRNVGEYNIGDFNVGIFNNETQKLRFFNKESDWTYEDWHNSKAREILGGMPVRQIVFIQENYMTEKEKQEHTESETTGGYLKELKPTMKEKQEWWDKLPQSDKFQVISLPNFDKIVFFEITGIRV